MLPQRYEEAVPLGRLTRHPANFNQGDMGLLCTLFEANGFAGAVLAQESSGILIDGETRLDAAEAEGLDAIPVIWIDITDDERDRLLGSWNESGRRGMNDLAKLVTFLQAMTVTPRGLDGLVFDGNDLDAAIKALQPPEPPDEFPPYDDDLDTEYQCPKCSYQWSGKPK